MHQSFIQQSKIHYLLKKVEKNGYPKTFVRTVHTMIRGTNSRAKSNRKIILSFNRNIWTNRKNTPELKESQLFTGHPKFCESLNPNQKIHRKQGNEQKTIEKPVACIVTSVISAKPEEKKWLLESAITN